MRKRRLLKVAEYESYVPGKEFLVRVADVRINLKTSRLLVRLEHLSSEQDGRVQEVILPLPIHVSGRTAAFFRACGVAVRPDGEIDLADAVGRKLTVRFEPGAEGPIAYFDCTVREGSHGPSTR